MSASWNAGTIPPRSELAVKDLTGRAQARGLESADLKRQPRGLCRFGAGRPLKAEEVPVRIREIHSTSRHDSLSVAAQELVGLVPARWSRDAVDGRACAEQDLDRFQ